MKKLPFLVAPNPIRLSTNAICDILVAAESELEVDIRPFLQRLTHASDYWFGLATMPIGVAARVF